MGELYKDFADAMFTDHDPPCLSLYQPTHRYHPDNQQDPILFRNLVKTLEESLLRQYGKVEVQSLLTPFLTLAEDHDLWNHTYEGLAVLGGRDFFRVYKLLRPVGQLAVVADSFHTKPLMRVLQSADNFHVLALSRSDIRLFEGNRDALEEIELKKDVPQTITAALGDELTDPHHTMASYGGASGGQAAMHQGHGGRAAEMDIDRERFFRAVDRAVFEHYSRPSGLPLVLAALPEHHHVFHSVSHNPFLLKESITNHPDSLSSIDELRRLAWELLEPRYLQRLTGLVEAYGQARARELGHDDPVQVAKAVVQGRVATLLIEAGREIPGRIDSQIGELHTAELVDPTVDDILDDLAALVLDRDEQVVVAPAEQMPVTTGLAAIYRY